jgi:hypothetical protein
MTTYATRYPLQQLMNTHAMGDVRRSTRRSSARIAEQEDALLVNGNDHEADKLRESHANSSRSKKKAPESNGSGQAATSGKGKGKRKLGVYTFRDVAGSGVFAWLFLSNPPHDL